MIGNNWRKIAIFAKNLPRGEHLGEDGPLNPLKDNMKNKTNQYDIISHLWN